METKEQTARKQLESFRRRSRPLESLKQEACRSKGTREFQNKEQTARKELATRLESLKTRGKPLARN